MNILDNKGGRKFTLTVLVLAGLFLLVAFGRIPTDDFRFLVMFIFGGYLGGNLGQRMIEKGFQSTPPE